MEFSCNLITMWMMRLGWSLMKISAHAAPVVQTGKVAVIDTKAQRINRMLWSRQPRRECWLSVRCMPRVGEPMSTGNTFVCLGGCPAEVCSRVGGI